MAERIPLKPVDRVEILVAVDNVFDMLLPGSEVAVRKGAAVLEGKKVPAAEAPLLVSGQAAETPAAEHGLAFLVSVTSGDTRRTVLFDTGSTVEGLVHNLRVLGVDMSDVEAIILSHGHFDHTTGLNGLAKQLQPLPPLVVHPDVWLRRRVAIPGRKPYELPAISQEQVRAAGFEIIESRAPSSLLDGDLLVTGEIARTTEFERGLPVQQAFRDGEWQPDPLVHDDQALVVNVRGKGLVVITGCGHAGLINTIRYARELADIERLHAVVGGFHLAGPVFEPLIVPTLEALAEMEPEVVAPTHCTGWRATHAIAAAFPEAFIPGCVGTMYVIESEGG